MPLRDHFRPPLDDIASWEGLYGAWPAMIVMALNRKLPPRYVAAPRVHLGPFMEIDVSAHDKDQRAGFSATATTGPGDVEGEGQGGVATAVWAPPRPTLDVITNLPDQDAYEVRIYDTKRRRRLVAAVEIVSPGNKDRPENRRAFVTKCAALLQQGVSVAIVDLVTTRQFNLYGDLLEQIGETDPALTPEPPPLYAAACRWIRRGEDWHFQTWNHPLALGQPLPTLPLWLADDLAVPLELEASYEEACRILRLV
jgi:hypothetical protein